MNIGKISATIGAIAVGTLLVTSERSFAATFGNSIDPISSCPNGDCSLQSFFDSMTLSGPGIDAVNDQTGFDVFKNTATANSTATFMFEITEIAETNSFGIYNVKDPLEKVKLFDGAYSSSAGSTVYFTDSQIVVWTGQFSPIDGQFLMDPPPGFNVFDFDWNRFGFYLERGDGTTFFSQSSLNPNGDQQAIVYRGDNLTEMEIPGRPSGPFTDNEFIIAFEDIGLGDGSDADYNDLVVMLESIEPVPEPGAIAGLGAIVASLVALRRGKKDKDS